MIPQRNLSLLSTRLAKQGGRRIPEAVLERDYCLAWFLVALSRTPLRHRLVFKGGTALKRCYFADYRFSEDLDFTLAQDTSWADLRAGLEAVFAEVARASGGLMRFAREDRHTHTNSYTFFLAYEGPLPPTRSGKEVKVDITLREQFVFPIAELPVLRGYPEYEDIPEDARIQVYSLGEVATEKIVALMDQARTEPRDLYDVWHLLGERHVDPADLLGAVETKLAFRTLRLADVRDRLSAKEARYAKLWETRLSAQMATLPDFPMVWRSVRRLLRQGGILKK